MRKLQGLPRKLRYAFLTQVLTASLTILAGTWLVVDVAKHEIAQQALQDEADYYFARRDAGDTRRPPPDEARLRGYVVAAGESASSVPEALRRLEPGMHQLPQQVVLVEDRGDTRLYLSYPRVALDLRSMQMVAAPVLLALLALLASAWFTYRDTRRMVEPLGRLAREVGHWDPMDPDTSALSPEQLPDTAGLETRQLADALQRMAERMRAFVRREREFTRDASHELRTPLTVIRVASDLLQGDPDLPQRSQRSLERIQLAGRDMEAVIDSFLILAREGSVEPQREDFAVAEVISQEVATARSLLATKPVELGIVQNADPTLHASPAVFGVMLRNLLSNACVFTESGAIKVRIEADRVIVTDTGIGMSAEAMQRAFDPFYRADPNRVSGKGMGLSIVRRLGERFGWPVTLESRLGQGTIATIRFGGNYS
ncbi:MAG: HAMP domain-containing sensor histidine kinase [Luteimonas sp.]